MQKSLFFSLGLAFLSACSSDEPGPKVAEDKLKTVSQFCKAWATAACNDDVVSNCDEADTETCVYNQAAFCAENLPEGYSSRRAPECIEAVKAAYADAELDAGDLNVVLQFGGACSHLANGGFDEGEDCLYSTQCDTVSGLSCVIKGGDTTGTCQDPKIQGKGEPCDADAAVCEDGAYCDGENCLVTKGNGKTCNYDAMCSTGYYCQKAEETDETGLCTRKLASKEDCVKDSECDSGICFPATSKCTSKIVLTAESTLCEDL